MNSIKAVNLLSYSTIIFFIILHVNRGQYFKCVKSCENDLDSIFKLNISFLSEAIKVSKKFLLKLLSSFSMFCFYNFEEFCQVLIFMNFRSHP